MDALNNPSVETIVVQSSSQIGKTEFGLNICGYFMHQDPCPILVLNPTLEMAETWSKDRFAPMIRDTPALTELIADPKSRSSGNTMLHKAFRGGHITMAGSNSPASLASRPIRIVIGDEVDRYPASAGTEGDPINLARKRTTTFWNRKIILVSTPTIKGASRIELAYLESDQRRYYVPCPHCKTPQHLVWAQVRWDKENPKEAWYECINCSYQIKASHKIGMIRQGKWQATSDFKGIAGFHLNELYSPWRTWGDVVVDFLAAQNNVELLKTWINTSLGETFDEQGGEGLEWQTLMARAEPYQPLTVPMGGLFLTAGVDVQGDRLAVSIWAWGEGEESWLVYHLELYGDPTLTKVWDELDTILLSNYTHESGTELKIIATAIDSGFKPQEVYNFVRRRPGRNMFAVKGSSTPGRPVIGKPTLQEVTYKGQTLKKGIRLWSVGVDVVKGIVYSRLRLSSSGAGYIHFYIGLDEEYYSQLTAEKIVTRFHKGFAKREWVKMRDRNEALDCCVYAYAAAIASGMARFNWNKMREEIVQSLEFKVQKEEEIHPAKSTIQNQKWINPNRGNFTNDW